MIVFRTARAINLPNVPSLLPSSELEGVQGEACISLWRKGVKWQRRKIKPWFAAREAESTAPKVSPEELTLLSRDLCSPASSRDSWHAAFCWCSSHKRRAEVLVEHSRLFACIWWWKRGGSGRTRQCQGRMREREDWGEGSCWSSSAEHPGPVLSGDTRSQMGDLLEHGERGWTRRQLEEFWGWWQEQGSRVKIEKSCINYLDN